MPTAEQFTAFGVGNGFTACLTKVDVSEYDWWTTLSGVNQASPTPSDALIAESLRLAMKLYWNLYSCVAPSSATFTDNTGTLPNESASVSNLNTSSHSRTEPRDRIFGFVTASVSDVSTPSGRANCQLFISNFASVRMYNGATTDEANFVGYGANSGLINTRGNASGRAASRVSLMGFVDESASTAGVYDYANVTVDGFHCICEARADGGDSEIPNASNLTASAAGSIGTSPNDRVYTSTSTITSLGFYTYE